jgi:hypothetical protein
VPLQLRDLWLELSTDAGDVVRLDVLSWLSKTTLEIIGAAGFGYDFDVLNIEDRPNELNEAFNRVFASAENPNILDFITIPFIGKIVSTHTTYCLWEWKNWTGGVSGIRQPTKRARSMAEGQATMRRIGMELVEEKKRAVIAAAGGDKNNVVREKGTTKGRDLLSLLIKANMASDLPADQRLSDEDVLARASAYRPFSPLGLRELL